VSASDLSAVFTQLLIVQAVAGGVTFGLVLAVVVPALRVIRLAHRHAAASLLRDLDVEETGSVNAPASRTDSGDELRADRRPERDRPFAVSTEDPAGVR
jgi:hypothetical protein